MSKRRVTVSVDGDLLAAGAKAVAQGRASSVSAWVNAAMAERVAAEWRLAALAALIDDFEAEHGTITDDELATQAQADRDAAAGVRARAAHHKGAA